MTMQDPALMGWLASISMRASASPGFAWYPRLPVAQAPSRPSRLAEVKKPVIAVVFYSTYGHISLLAERVIKGVESTGATVKPYQFAETLSEEILTKMHAGSSLKPKYPIITPNDLTTVDGIIIGAPTRYGRVPAQVSAFFDATGQLWATGALVGKFVSQFTSTASQHGGHESTYLTTFPFFAHHGLVYVPIGFSQSFLTGLDQAAGGSAYGVSTNTGGDGSKMPLEGELELAEFQGKYFADFVGTFVRGKHLAATATSASEAPVLGKAIPVKSETGYEVPAEAKAAEPVAAAPAAETAAPAAPAAPAETTAAPVEAAPTSAPAPVEKTAAPTPADAKPAKKKGGLLSCCGGSNID
ncbi:hypothetical protein Q5752_001760 [Cryptotrichosporon argae]